MCLGREVQGEFVALVVLDDQDIPDRPADLVLDCRATHKLKTKQVQERISFTDGDRYVRGLGSPTVPCRQDGIQQTLDLALFGTS